MAEVVLPWVGVVVLLAVIVGSIIENEIASIEFDDGPPDDDPEGKENVETTNVVTIGKRAA